MAIFKDFLDKIFGNKKEISLNNWVVSDDEIYNQLWAYRFALNVAAERIGALISKCEFRTYQRGKAVKEDNYYLLNLEPNPNQTAAEFRKQLVHQLICSPDHEALIVILDNVAGMSQAMYVADEFEKDEYQINPTYFKNVSVNLYQNSSFRLDGVFSGSNAIYIKYANSELDSIFNQMKQMYVTLINNAEKAGSYRMHYALEMDSTAQATPGFNEKLQNILNVQFRKFMEGENTVLPLYQGMKLNQTSAGADLGQNASTANKSVNSEVDDAITKVGLIFNLPSSVMLGSYESDDLDQVFNFCLDPFASMITQAFNRKWYGKRSVKGKTYCELTTKSVRHHDIVSIASTVNQAISSGTYSINEVRDELGMMPINEEWADKHFVTTNYAVVDAYVNASMNGANTQNSKSNVENLAKEGSQAVNGNGVSSDGGQGQDD